jgi:hypothetical protein
MKRAGEPYSSGQDAIDKAGTLREDGDLEGGRLYTPIFPVRFMRVTPTGLRAANREVDGGAHSRHLPLPGPVHVDVRDELKTLGNVFGGGMDLSPNEIVGIKDYERRSVQYLLHSRDRLRQSGD